jgi:RNA polymerase sigma-70 factor (sigma-E family)
MGDARDAEFTDFVASRSKTLFRTAYLLTGDHGLAEDLLQTALIKTYVGWGRIRAVENAEAYTRRVLVTTVTSWGRRKSWRSERPTERVPERATRPDDDVIAERDVVWREIQALAPRQRAAIVLRFYEDLTEKQTAAAMGCSVGNVKSQTHAALKNLRERLGDQIELELVRGRA